MSNKGLQSSQSVFWIRPHETKPFDGNKREDGSKILTSRSLEKSHRSKSKHSPIWTFSLISHNNSSSPRAAYMRQWNGSLLVQIMAWRLFSAKPLSKPMLRYCQLNPYKQSSVKFKPNFSFTEMHLQYRLRNGGHFVQGRRVIYWSYFAHGVDQFQIICPSSTVTICIYT